MRRQIELRPLVQMALEAGLWRLARIDDGSGCATGGHVQAPGPVTRFAPDILGVVSGRLQTKMARRCEIFCNVLMAGLARFGTDKRGSRNLRRSHQLLAHAGA